VPLCHGSVWPPAAPERVQMLHRFGGVIAGAVAITVALRVRRRAAGAPWLRALALVPIVLVVTQIGLGLASVLSLLNLTVITAHLAVGAALLGSLVVLWGLCPAPSAHAKVPPLRSTGSTSPDAVALP